MHHDIKVSIAVSCKSIADHDLLVDRDHDIGCDPEVIFDPHHDLHSGAGLAWTRSAGMLAS